MEIQILLFISLLCNCLLFIGFLYLRNTLNNTISLVKGLAKRMGIDIEIKI